MFRLVSDESSQKLGIEIHKKRVFAFETPFLSGSAMHDSTAGKYTVLVGPNYTSLSEMAEEKNTIKLSAEFDAARSHSLVLGNYSTLDVADAAISALDQWYREILKRSGANQRLLIERGNGYCLLNDPQASNLRYGEAILRARNVQAFSMMRDNKDLDHETVVAKIMPIFLHALGLKEYMMHDNRNEDGNREVRFILEEVGVFAFHKPQHEGRPAYVERYSYANGDYYLSFAGETTGDVLKTHVFEWLTSAARERDTLLREDFETHLDELAHDIRRTWIEKSIEKPVTLIDAKPELILPENVVSLAAYRPA